MAVTTPAEAQVDTPSGPETEATEGQLKEIAREGANQSIAALESGDVSVPEENKQAAVRAVVDAAQEIDEGTEDHEMLRYQMYYAAMGATYGALAGAGEYGLQPGAVTPAATYEIVYGSVYGATTAANLARVYALDRGTHYVTVEHTLMAAGGAAAGAAGAAGTHPELTPTTQDPAESTSLRDATRSGSSGAIMGTQGSWDRQNRLLMVDASRTYIAAEGATRGGLDAATQRIRENRPATAQEVQQGITNAAQGSLLSSVLFTNTDEELKAGAYQAGYDNVYTGQSASLTPQMRAPPQTDQPADSTDRRYGSSQGPPAE